MKCKIFQMASIGTALGVSFFVSKPVHAITLSANVLSDTPLNLHVSWSGSGLDDGQNNDFLAGPTLSNWLVPQTQLTYLGGGNGWQGTLTTRHTTDPHPGLGENGGGGQVSFGIAFKQSVDKDITESAGISHGSFHADNYRFSYQYTAATDTLNVDLQGQHVPEPLTILGTGVVLGALPALKKEYAKRNKKKDGNA